jgi:hypothetical protein
MCEGTVRTKVNTSQDNSSASIEAWIIAAEGRGPLLHARVGMLRAMNQGKEGVFSDRKETHWGKRKLKQDE